VDDQDNYEGIDFRVNPPQRSRGNSPVLRWIVTGVAIVSSLIVFIQLANSYAQRRAISTLNNQHVMQANTIDQLKKRISDLQGQLGKVETVNGDLSQQLSACKQSRKSQHSLSHKNTHH
jgi:septal ring factor EnvC (AmiA/AmiB activator)